MIFTNDASLVTHPATTKPLIDRTKNTAVVRLDKDQVLDLIGELAHHFEDSPIKEIYLVVEDLYPDAPGDQIFYPKDME